MFSREAWLKLKQKCFSKKIKCPVFEFPYTLELLAIADKNSLFGKASIGETELCVMRKRAATYGGPGLLYRSAVYESAGMGQPDLVKD